MLMSEQIIDSKQLNFGNIQSLYVKYDPVEATKIIMGIYGHDMHHYIPDKEFRIMIWQVSHTLEFLESKAGILISLLSDLDALLKHNNAIYVIATRTLIAAFDNIDRYVSS